MPNLRRSAPEDGGEAEPCFACDEGRVHSSLFEYGAPPSFPCPPEIVLQVPSFDRRRGGSPCSARAERMYEEKLILDAPVEFASEVERTACIAFFNAAFSRGGVGPQAGARAGEGHGGDGPGGSPSA